MKKYQKNEQITVLITDMTKDGEGIGKADGFTIFVKDTVPGDRILAVITKVKKTYGYARLLTILEPSADRVDAPCPVARQCGGCKLQMMRYEKQSDFKRRIVCDALERIGGFRTTLGLYETDSSGKKVIPVDETVSAGPKFRYRNKAVVPVGKDKEDNPVAGFYAGRTHVIIPFKDCLLGPKEYGKIIADILNWMKTEHVSAYDESTGKGLIRHVFMRKSRETEEIQICLIINGRIIPGIDSLRKVLENNDPERKIVGVLYSTNCRRTNVIFGERPKLLWGKEYLTDSLRSDKYGISVRYQISPASFYQVNPWIAERMYEHVLELTQLNGTETVYDLYCGTGTISLFLAKKAGRVIGVETVSDAVKNAKRNAEINNLNNVCFLEGKAEEVMPELYKKEELKADVVVVDPPRRGCDEVLLKTIINMQPEKVIYVSCDPATLARDIRILSDNGYLIESVRPYDQFVYTSHVESVVKLTRTGV